MKGRLVLGWFVLLGGPAAMLIAGNWNLPNASTCHAINSVQTSLGEPPTCSTTPAAGWYIAAAVLAGVGLLILAPWWLRRLAGKKPPTTN